MNKNKKKQINTKGMKKTTSIVPEDSFLTEAVQIADSRDPKTNAAIPDDRHVEAARKYVEENKK